LMVYDEISKYKNFELESGAQLGACRQPRGSGGSKRQGETINNLKIRIRWNTTDQRKTAWLRACSYWSAFHALALRADFKGGDLPNKLFGSIVRIIAGGALFCGG